MDMNLESMGEEEEKVGNDLSPISGGGLMGLKKVRNAL